MRSHLGRVVQRVVCIDSSRFSEDFGNEIGLSRPGRHRDWRLLEDLFEVGNLEGFSGDSPCVKRAEDSCSKALTILLPSSTSLKQRKGGVTNCGALPVT